MNILETTLRALQGSRVTSVEFLEGYLGIAFDNRTAMSILVWPEIRYQGKVLSFREKNYPEVIRSLIDSPVLDIRYHNDFTDLIFNGNTEIRILLEVDTPSGEHILVTTPDRSLIVR